jgi:hypothetical protein
MYPEPCSLSCRGTVVFFFWISLIDAAVQFAGARLRRAAESLDPRRVSRRKKRGEKKKTDEA